MTDDRLSPGDRVEIRRDPAFGERLLATVPVEETNVTSEPQAWELAARRWVADHPDLSSEAVADHVHALALKSDRELVAVLRDVLDDLGIDPDDL
jgi:hypothetical protein